MTLLWCPIQRDVVTVAGPDAASYLQGQLSQDVVGLGEGESAWTFVLAPTGKVDGFARVQRTGPEAFALDTDVGAGQGLHARLRRFLLRTRAELAVVGAVDGVAHRGDGAPPGLIGWWGAATASDALGADTGPTGGQRIEPDALERLRIDAGWPAVGAELTPDTIPAESGVVPVAVSFTKGCYTGQELVARIDSRGGNVPRRLRRLRRVRADDPAIPAGARLVDEAGKEVGWVTSSAGDVALGYVARAVEPPATVQAGEAGPAIAVEEITPPG